MELTILRPETTVSPHYLARKTKIPLQLVEDILTSLAHDKLLDTKFIIFCNNGDPELVHGFEFVNKKELRDFIVKNKFLCPDCGENLNTQDIRVAFLKKDLPHKAL
ncbi:hypothetical protein [Cytobacillus gottheilii]|uniref:hypothetical protein n=1 Tax=Cytobacillus gottheilii TaxID=859144 RepID=UPI0008346D4E|nr:hypothetical protein [Cytobacillus gottheilii]